MRPISAEIIVRDLATLDVPLYYYLNDTRHCALCGVVGQTLIVLYDPENHDERCTWRRAKEWVEHQEHVHISIEGLTPR